MKKEDIKVGMRVFKSSNIASMTIINDKLTYGTVVKEPYGTGTGRRKLWKADIKFDSGITKDVPINLIQKTNRKQID